VREDLLAKYIRVTDPRAVADSELIDADGTAASGPVHHVPKPFIAMLDFIRLGGSHSAFPYAHLLRAQYDPSIGIKLHFATHMVLIRGRSLQAFYDSILAHAVGRIIAIGERHDSEINDEVPIVHTISIRKVGRTD
jgi:hypothetical protein